jgi:hypothetical protein
MTVSRSFVAAAALIAAIATSITGATAALATPATAGSFELTLDYQILWWEGASTGTFAAGAPFCDSGTSVGPTARVDAAGEEHRLTCDDGSGSLVVSFTSDPSLDSSWQGSWVTWRILEGTGSYEGLRGKGSVRNEILGEDDCVPSDVVGDESCEGPFMWRSTLEGIAAEDAVAPTIGFSSVEVTKLRRPGGAYSLELAIALRDDVEGRPVSYTLLATPASSARELASSLGTTQAGSVSVTMRTPRVYGLRSILLRLTASDEVGNESSVSQVVKLTR